MKGRERVGSQGKPPECVERMGLEMEGETWVRGKDFSLRRATPVGMFLHFEMAGPREIRIEKDLQI